MDALSREATSRIEDNNIHHEYMSLYAPVLLHGDTGEGESVCHQLRALSPPRPQPRVLHVAQPEAVPSQGIAVDRNKSLLLTSLTSSAASSQQQQQQRPPPLPVKVAAAEEIPRSVTPNRALIQRAIEVLRSEKEPKTRSRDHRIEEDLPEEPKSKEAILDRCEQIKALQQERIRRKEYLETQRFPLLQDPPTNKNVSEAASKKDDLTKSMGVRDAQWESHFQRLVAYKEEHGHTMVPTHFPPDIQLGNWVRNQRLNYKNNGISEARKQRLNEIGFMWVFYDRSTSRWEEMFNRLKDYKDENGDANVPLRYTKDPQLGAWVNYQRTTQRQGKLSVQKVSKLDSLEFEWNPMKHAATWEHMFWRLLAYKNCHGHTRVPFRYKADPQLGYWVSNQRAFYRKKRLSRERQILLESIGLFPRAKLLSTSAASTNTANNNNNTIDNINIDNNTINKSNDDAASIAAAVAGAMDLYQGNQSHF